MSTKTTTYLFDFEYGQKLLNSPYSKFFSPIGITADGKKMYLGTTLSLTEVDSIRI